MARHLGAHDQSRVPVGPGVVELPAGSADAAVRLEHMSSNPTAEAACRLGLPHQGEGPRAAVEEISLAHVADGPVGIHLVQQPSGRSPPDPPVARQTISLPFCRQLAAGKLHLVGDSTSRSGALPRPISSRRETRDGSTERHGAGVTCRGAGRAWPDLWWGAGKGNRRDS